MVKFWKKYPENEPENENVLCLFKDKKTVCIGFNHIKFARALLGSETIDKEVVAFCYIDDIIALINPNPEAKELLDIISTLEDASPEIVEINKDINNLFERNKCSYELRNRAAFISYRIHSAIKTLKAFIEKIGGAK